MQAFEREAATYRGMGKNMLNGLPTENTKDIPSYHSNETDRINGLVKFNKNLDEHMDLLQLNEDLIESKLEELESLLSKYDRIEKYSLIRLTEMALLCAGNYANNNCITEVGDFIFNPRLIHIHIKGEPVPVTKERHTRLTVQFKDRATENCSVPEWFKLNTLLETVKKPLLPHLLNLLEQAHCCRKYIISVEKRINMLIENLSYLSMANIPKGTNIEEWKNTLEDADRIMMENLFFQFDPRIYYELGEKIQLGYNCHGQSLS